MEAEHALARSKGPDLYSLDEIYIQLGASSPSPQEEMDLEEKLCFPVTEGRLLLTAARRRGERVIFASDMYLPGKFIRKLLEKHGLWQEGDRLFVSHEHGVAKHRGLFQKICKELSVRPEHIEHTGDNLRSDVLVPQSLGIRAVHFRVTERSRYEIEWMQKGGEEGAAMADALRAARLQFPERLDDRGKILWETACDVAAPLFVAYVGWLGREARKLGLERLYFVSRDGLIFKKIYDFLFGQERKFPRSHYLYGSRQAWSCVRAAFLLEEDIEAMVQTTTSLTLRQFYGRCGWSTPPSVQLPWNQLPPQDDEPLRAEQIDQLKGFMRTGELRERVKAQGQRLLKEAREFLQQEGLGAGSYGVVDLGWYGNLQAFLEKILPQNPPAAGFYLDLKKKPDSAKQVKRNAFLPFGRFQGIRGSVATTLLEILAAAPHGTVLGYESQGHRREAILAGQPSGTGPEETAWIHHDAVLRSAEELKRQGILDKISVPPEGDAAMLTNLQALIDHPSAGEATAYGQVHFISRQEGGGETEFAPFLSWSQALVMIWKGFWSREALWPQACIRRSRGCAKLVLWLRFMVTACKEKAVFFCRAIWGRP